MKNLISFLIRRVPRKYLQRVAGIGGKMLSLAYRGSAVTCPVCDTSFRTFLAYGRLNPRPNALCPECLSLERHRLIYLYLKSRGFLDKKLSVLHIAPEACFIPRFEKVHGDSYITADIESPLAKVKMDIHKIPFESEHFDVVLCNHVLEHVDNDLKAMSEIARVLKKNGYAILQVPFFHPIPERTFEDFTITNPQQREKAFGQDDHVRKYGRDYSERIKQAGLTPIEDRFVFNLDNAAVKRFGLAEGEIIYGGVK
jgi:SAM-dependent methyltransferase